MITRCAVLVAFVGLLAPSPVRADEPAKLRDTLMTLEKDSWEMAKKQDIEGFKKFFADQATLILVDGTRFDKAGYLKLLPDYKLDSYKIDDKFDLIVLSPEAATIVYRITYTYAIKGETPKKVTVLSSSCYVRRDGKWLSIIYQETPTK